MQDLACCENARVGLHVTLPAYRVWVCCMSHSLVLHSLLRVACHIATVLHACAHNNVHSGLNSTELQLVGHGHGLASYRSPLPIMIMS